MKRALILFSIILISFSSCTSIYQRMKEKRDVNYKQGLTEYRQKKYSKARDHFDTVVSIDPEYKRARYYLNKSKYFIKRKDRKVKRKNNLNYSRAMYYKKRKKYETSLHFFLKVQEKDPDYDDVDDQIDQCREKLQRTYNWRIRVSKKQYKRRQYKKAYRNALKAKKIKPQGSEAKSLLADIQYVLHRKTSTYKKRANYYYKIKKYSKAKKEAKKMLRINPWNQYAINMNKKCNRMIGIGKDYKTAQKLYRKKKYFVARKIFRSINSREKNYKYTKIYLKKIERALLKSIGVYYSRGVRYYDKEKFAKAIQQWNIVLSINPNHRKATEFKARAKAKLEIKQSLKQQK